jgi:hypothetical protein
MKRKEGTLLEEDVLRKAKRRAVDDQAQRFIRCCAQGELSGILPQTVWQEVAHKPMLAEANQCRP